MLGNKRWARYTIMVLAVLDLFNFGLGTIIGIYSLWALVHEETVAIFYPPDPEEG